MAVEGEVIVARQQVAQDGYLDVIPPSGEDWAVLSIHVEGPYELYDYDGTTASRFDGDSSSFYGAGIVLSSSMGIRVRNVHDSAQYVTVRCRCIRKVV